MEGKSHDHIYMSTFVKICIDSIGNCIDHTLYKSIIGNLLYITTSRLDITFSVGTCARFETNPKDLIL